MLAPPPDDEHDCGWKAYAKAQDAKLTEMSEQLAAVTAKLTEIEQRRGTHHSERRKRPKMPPPLAPKNDPAETERKRRAAAELRSTKVETVIEAVPVPPEACKCPTCGGEKLRNVGFGKPSTMYEYVPGYLRKRVFQRQTLSCRCGYIVTAPAPGRVGDKTRYAPSFIAHLIFTKCSSSMPQYRLEKEYRNLGIPVSRSTMCTLFHRGASELRPSMPRRARSCPPPPTCTPTRRASGRSTSTRGPTSGTS